MTHFLDFAYKPSEGETDMNSWLKEEFNNMDPLDLPLNYDDSPELMSSEFFDSVLSMEKQNNETDAFLRDFHNEITSSEGSVSPTQNIASDQGSVDFESFDYNEHFKSSVEAEGLLSFMLEAGCTEKTIDSIIKPDLTSQCMNVEKHNSPTVVLNTQNKKLTISKPIDLNAKNNVIQKKPQVIRVQSLSGNGRSLLLPYNVKNVKKFKIINAADIKMESLKVISSTLNSFKSEKYAASTSSESVDEIDVDVDSITQEHPLHRTPVHHRQPQQQQQRQLNANGYPKLELTAEEKRLLSKEGIKLPSHYPLSKSEEKDLKRIRRKIRNKISAQDSRKRKKEYVDQLEEKARKTDEENELLKKRVKYLNRENSKLHEQLKKIQDVLFNPSSKATPTTCLMIVLFSTLLVCLPNLRTTSSGGGGGSQELADIGAEQQQLVAARRALLFKQQANTNEDDTSNLEEFLVFNNREEEEEKENSTTKVFIRNLSEFSKKYEQLIKSNCSEMLKNNFVQVFCQKNEKELSELMDTLKNILHVDEKKYIEPDITDDEYEEENNVVKFRRRNNAYLSDDDDPPTKKAHLSSTLSSSFESSEGHNKNFIVLDDTSVVDFNVLPTANQLPVKVVE